ncbi:MAG: DoxX family protein [Fibrobacterota bacterium]
MKQKNYIHEGLLFLRIGIGITMMLHGVPKLLGGPEQWTNIGTMGMGALGITFAPAFWGLIAALSEALGGLLLILGKYVRPAAFFLFFTMLAAALFHLSQGSGFKGSAHAIELAVLFAALFIIGEPKLTPDLLFGRK